MAKVVLHIGTHKTATTTIQDMFSLNAGLLAQHGLIYPHLYPRLPAVTGHHGLVMDWNPLPKHYELPGGSVAALSRIAANHAGSDRTVFLSSEEFSRGRDGARVDFTALRQALSAFDEIEVICVLREQWQFVQSIYLEVSKIQVPPRPPQFVEMVLRDDIVEGLWTDYNKLYDHLLQSFAPEEITLLDFDSCRRAEGGMIGTLLAHLGVPLQASDLELIHGGHSNTSPQPLPAWAANLITEPHVAPRDFVDTVVTKAFAGQFGPKARGILWSREECRALRDYARDRNERLAARKPGFALSVTPQREDDIYREDLRADFWLRCNRWTFTSLKSTQNALAQAQAEIKLADTKLAEAKAAEAKASQALKAATTAASPVIAVSAVEETPAPSPSAQS